VDPDRIRISEITEADLRDVLTIEGLSFSAPWNEEMFKSELSFDFFHSFAAKLNLNGTGDVLVGYICFWLFYGEAHLLNIAVKPEYRRMGLGAHLVRFFVDFCRAKKAKTLTLDVRSSNHPAIKMYRKMGFRKEGMRLRYYADNGEDALIMGLKLNEG
jgi:ribosomal-protein-alanine N-acetyltransferase